MCKVLSFRFDQSIKALCPIFDLNALVFALSQYSIHILDDFIKQKKSLGLKVGKDSVNRKSLICFRFGAVHTLRKALIRI